MDLQELVARLAGAREDSGGYCSVPWPEHSSLRLCDKSALNRDPHGFQNLQPRSLAIQFFNCFRDLDCQIQVRIPAYDHDAVGCYGLKVPKSALERSDPPA